MPKIMEIIEKETKGKRIMLIRITMIILAYYLLIIMTFPI